MRSGAWRCDRGGRCGGNREWHGWRADGDIEAEGKRIGAKMLEYIHRSKTAALIRASVTAGALCAGAPAKDVTRLRKFGETIGWAFQVTDDILDVEESSAALEKTAGKDVAQQKATYPALYGLPRSHEIANELANKAIAALEPYAERAGSIARDCGISGVAAGVIVSPISPDANGLL
jgi:geranylgeranyl pyrophosphate synthase